MSLSRYSKSCVVVTLGFNVDDDAGEFRHDVAVARRAYK